MRDNVNLNEYYILDNRLYQKKSKNEGGDLDRGQWPASAAAVPRGAERAAGTGPADKVRFMKESAQNLWGEATKSFHRSGAEFDQVMQGDAEFDSLKDPSLKKAFRAVKGLQDGTLDPQDACSHIKMKEVCDRDTHGKCEYKGGIFGYGKKCKPRVQGSGFDADAMSLGEPRGALGGLKTKAALGTALGGLAGVVTANPVVGALGASVGRYFGRRRDRADTQKKLHNVVKFLWLLQNVKTTNSLAKEGMYVKGDPSLNALFRERIEDIQGILRGTRRAVEVPEGGDRAQEMSADVYRKLYANIEYSAPREG